MSFEARPCAPIAMEGTDETDSLAEEEGFEPSVPLVSRGCRGFPFEEAEAFAGVELLDDPVDRETGKVLGRLAEPGSPVTLLGGERLFAVERCGDRVHDGGDAHRLLDRFLRDAGVLQRVVMRLDAGAAAVDR